MTPRLIYRFCLILYSILAANASVHAQHCGFDGSYLIGVRPFYGDSTNIIEGLRVTLVDKNRQEIWFPGLPAAEIKSSDQIFPCTFTRNKKKILANPHRVIPNQDRFYSFAENDYVLVHAKLPSRISPHFILVEDVDGEKNGGFFKTQYIELTQSSHVHLCGYEEDHASQQQANYKPHLVNLEEYAAGQVQREEVGNFIFQLDWSPENAETCEAIGCYCAELKVIHRLDLRTIFDTVICGTRNFNDQSAHSIYQTGDYNFDWSTDFRLCHDGYNYMPYFLFNPNTIAFDKDPLLSSLYTVDFDNTKRVATGRTKLKPSGNGAYPYAFDTYTIGPGYKKQVRVVQTLSGSPAWHADNKEVAHYYYQNGKRLEDILPYQTLKTDLPFFTKTVGNFRFEKQRVWIPLPGIPEEPASFSFAHNFRIYDIKANQLIFERQDELCPQNELCIDSIDVRDYDFDGSPDLRIWLSKNYPDYAYYSYDSKQKTFVKNSISKIIELKINFETKSATGYTLVYAPSMSLPIKRLDHVMKGPGLPIVETKETILTENIPVPVSPPVHQPIYSVVNGRFRYELDDINAKDQIEVIPMPGNYAQKLSIYDTADNSLYYKHFIQGNHNEERFQTRTYMTVEQINFDGIADVKIPSLKEPNEFIVVLSCQLDSNASSLWFYRDIQFEKLESYERDESKMTITGLQHSGYDEIFYEYKGKWLDSLSIITQLEEHPETATKQTYVNRCGMKLLLTTDEVAPVVQPLNKEFGDFNFDGHEDFRIQNANDLSKWEVFLFDEHLSSFKKDSLMSELQKSYYNPTSKQYLGSIFTQLSELSSQTVGYEVIQSKCIATSKTTCTRTTVLADQSDCILEKWIKGKWKKVDDIGIENVAH